MSESQERSRRRFGYEAASQVNVDAISAKLGNGVLRVDVPKLDAGYVEIKKADTE